MNEINAFLFRGQRTALQAGDIIRYSGERRQLSFHRDGEVIGIRFQRQTMKEAGAIEMPMPSRDFFGVICNLLAANQNLLTQKYQEEQWAIELTAPTATALAA